MATTTGMPLLRFTAMAAVVLLCLISVDMAGAQCEGDIPSLISQCAKYVRKEGPKMKPSKACCSVAKKASLPCICKYATKEIEQYIDITKVFYVTQTCGIPLQRGAKCGSYTVPKQTQSVRS